MFLSLVAFAVAFFALIKGSDLADRVGRLEKERDDLLRRTESLQRLIDRVVNSSEALPPLPVSSAAGTQEPAKAKAAVETPHAKADEVPAQAMPPAAPAEQAPVKPTPPRPSQPPSPTPPPAISKPPEPMAPPIDWESLLGVKGAAWVGGIALITSAIFFARWTIEQGLVTPELRFAMMLFGGISALVAAESGLRKGYERTANPVSGAGIAILYIAFFAGHSRYDLISMPTAFMGMVLVTVTACVLAVRYDAFPTAALGLLGGFATPVALSTGEDRPFGLFSYILLLNIGLLSVGVKRRWPGLFELGLVGTLLIQLGWYSKFMSPANMLVGLIAFFLLGIVYLVLPLIGKGEESERVMRTGAIGGIAPFLFAAFLAGSPQYVEQWPLLFGMVGLLDLAILAMAALRGRVSLLLSAAVATSLTLALWAAEGLKASSGVSVLAATVAAVAIVSIFSLARRVVLRFGTHDESAGRVVEVARLTAWAGLGWFGLIMIGRDRGSPEAPFLLLASALAFILVEHAGHEGRIKGALAVFSLALATLVQIWFFRTVESATLLPYLAAPVLLSLLLSFFAGRKAGQEKDVEAELAVRLCAWIGIMGLFLALVEKSWAAPGWPLFVALFFHVLILVGSVLRSDWTIGLPALLGASAAHLLFWQLAYLKPEGYNIAFGFSGLFYLFFLLLPMVVPFAKWREALLPWLTSALAGPAFFLSFYNVFVAAFGDSAIGLLPIAMAAVSVVALRMVSSRFAVTATQNDTLGSRLRLRYLALFTAVALWFIAVAIPLQLDRQWITLGWALEAMALCWLFGRLPHRGLPVFAGVLFGFVGLRLLLNPEVLQYEERGTPLFNWILYTYGTATACCLIGQFLLRRATPDRLIGRLADAIALNGLLLGFWLVNLEILDYFSTGAHIALSDQSGYSVKLALSAGWGLYAMVLLVTGVAKDLKPLRYLSLAFLILTVAKVFLYDLSALGGIFRVLSFLGLAVALILVSLFYQRFVFKKNPQ